MTDLTNIMGGPWSPPVAIEPDPPEVQLLDAISNSGMTPPKSIVLDGKLHRFNAGTKGKAGHDKSGWYIAFGDGVPAGRFGCWRSGIETVWRADMGRQLTAIEEMAHTRRMAEAKAARDAELEKSRTVASDTVSEIWSNCTGADPAHPYLARKNIQPHGARVTGDGRLVVPLFSPEGNLASLQYIDAEGGKLYHSGGQTGGCYWTIGSYDEAGPIYIAEGFATAATISEITGRPCVASYSASNLVPVTEHLRETLGKMAELVIVADNDASGTGQKYADQAAAKYGARSVLIPIEGDANDYVAAGHDLSVILAPNVTDWLVPADEFSSQPMPIRWLVKHWLQEQALIMVHGPSGGGKTFAVLDWCLHIASGKTDWNGHKVKPGAIVYLAGEGHHGMRSRIAAWKQHHGADHIEMWVSKAGCDLNTAEGYTRVVESVRALPVKPSIITVDTLHRFLSGDENSAQDAKTMIDACAALMREFECSVVLVHHTGVSEEAQHRARGSSAWKGALEIEISVIPAKGDAPMQLVQRKSKDSEEAKPIYASLKLVPINGWIDEDGEPVTSAVLVQEEAPPERQKPSKLDDFKKIIRGAWWEGGTEYRDDTPYISRSVLATKLEKDGVKNERTLRNMLNPSYTDKLIGALIMGEIIEKYEHGWVIVDAELLSTLALEKGFKDNDPK